MSVESLPRTIDINEQGTVATIIDQRKLPKDLVFIEVVTWEQMVDCLKTLAVRGAPAIGVAGAYALVLALKNQFDLAGQSVQECLVFLKETADQVSQARPTAVNLAWAVNQVLSAVEEADCKTCADIVVAAEGKAREIRDADEESCRAIGAHGAELLKPGSRVLTHCNAGSLATAFYGTALGVIYAAHEQGKIAHVYADETRPVGQGARLTVWELAQAGVPVTLQCDNMAASLMAKGEIDAVIVGADRICSNGDTANKIGTYGLAVLAKHHGIPMYIAAPFSTIDASMRSGEEIPIEHRAASEISAVIPNGVEVYNPAFDVTPAELISAIITEKGVFYPPFKF